MKKFALTLGLALVGTMAFAQDDQDDSHQISFAIPATSILDIEGPGGNNGINFTPEAITEAGNAFDFNLSNSTLWLNYSNIKASAETTRKVTVGMTNDLPTGMTLTVAAGTDAGNGNGVKGTPNASAITLANGSSSTIITGIGSAYTGNGINNGHQLTYNLSFDDAEFQTLSADLNESVTITYTIADE